MTKRSIVLDLAVVLLSTACSVLTEPREYTLPERDYSIDPAALVAPKLLFGCGRWAVANPPKDKKIFVDIQFVRPTLADPGDRVYRSHIAAVEKHGGEIVYEFHFPVARVWISANEIPELAKESGIDGFYSVSNLRRYDWPTGVGYVKPYSFEEGAVRFEQLGGRVYSRYNTINAIGGLIPDVAAAVLRQDKRVDYAESQGGIYCF